MTEVITENSLPLYFPGSAIHNQYNWPSALAWLRPHLQGHKSFPVTDWESTVSALEKEGLLTYFAYHINQHASSLPDHIQEQLNTSLKKEALVKLQGDAELFRITKHLNQHSLQGLVFKGEALARNLYPDPVCRLSADFDLLVKPSDSVVARRLLKELGYTAGRYLGTHIFAEQAWTLKDANKGFLIDLHWDITSRRFFRNRLPLQRLFDTAVRLEEYGIQTPSYQHSLVLACVHLAAAAPRTAVQLKWLLDIWLLLESISSEEFEQVIADTRGWKLVDTLAIYIHMTYSTFGPGKHHQIGYELFQKINHKRRQFYKTTVENRGLDISEYGVRLLNPIRQLGLLKEVFRTLRLRRREDWSDSW